MTHLPAPAVDGAHVHPPNSIAIEFLVREVGVELTKMLQANYPDNMRRMFVINGN